MNELIHRMPWLVLLLFRVTDDHHTEVEGIFTAATALVDVPVVVITIVVVVVVVAISMTNDHSLPSLIWPLCSYPYYYCHFNDR